MRIAHGVRQSPPEFVAERRKRTRRDRVVSPTLSLWVLRGLPLIVWAKASSLPQGSYTLFKHSTFLSQNPSVVDLVNSGFVTGRKTRYKPCRGSFISLKPSLSERLPCKFLTIQLSRPTLILTGPHIAPPMTRWPSRRCLPSQPSSRRNRPRRPPKTRA